jgi:hypothetical protein
MIRWQDQHCGVIEATPAQLAHLMPEVAKMVFDTFPIHERVCDFWWDVRVSMLMPGQWPAIPNWHFDHIPRAGGSRTDSRRDFKAVEKTKHLPMYMWLSGPPFTEFKDGREVRAETWVRFTQLDSHRAVAATEHCWRGFIRAVHKGIHDRHPEIPVLRRHSQVYLDAKSFNW